MTNSISGNQFPQEYLRDIQNEAFTRMDSVKNGGNGDGRVDTYEAFQDLHVGSLFDGLKEGSAEYDSLKAAASDITSVLEQYAGDDGEFTAEEWAEFLNGDEWGEVLDAYHSSSARSKIEMSWIDNSDGMLADGKTTKGEVKVGFLQNLANKGIDVDTTSFEKLIDEYAGEDGTFTVEEYTAMRNDPMYKAFTEKYNIAPYHFSRKQEDQEASSNVQSDTAHQKLSLDNAYQTRMDDLQDELSHTTDSAEKQKIADEIIALKMQHEQEMQALDGQE